MYLPEVVPRFFFLDLKFCLVHHYSLLQRLYHLVYSLQKGLVVQQILYHFFHYKIKYINVYFK